MLLVRSLVWFFAKTKINTCIRTYGNEYLYCNLKNNFFIFNLTLQTIKLQQTLRFKIIALINYKNR